MHQIWLVPAFPLIGFILNGLFGKFFGKRFVSIVGPLSIGLAFLQSLVLFFAMLSTEGHALHEQLYTWMQSGILNLDVGFQVDQLSGLFLLIITGVGFLIHVYSIGYMYEEDAFYRFFAYLNLFVFFMLILVLGDNFILMFVGWEGVGLCSYLLIGYYFEKQSAIDASKKAFITNRIGDFGFLSGVMLIFIYFNTLNFSEVNSSAGTVLENGGLIVTLITLFLFLGATGKSAQIPLYVWLPDAMEGPTPVSALIHAATMVTSGLYMIARLSHLFVLAPITMAIVASVGAVTAILAATIAITQTDIKRVLAYSTVSQLGYMFLAMGVGAFGVGIFHVMTHAFFKALLFLCSGAVIYSLHHEQDMMKMGALRKKLPVTFATMMIGTIAITGIPPFAGFFSKDEILWKTWSSGNFALWFIGFLTALLTSFYMFRLMFLTFYGNSRVDPHTESHIHESPVSMLAPLVVLAILSIFGGFFGVPHILHFLPNGIEHYFEGFYAEVQAGHGTVTAEIILMVLSVFVAALIPAWFAWKTYGGKLDTADQRKENFAFFHNLSLNKYYVDEIYNGGIIQPIKKISDLVFWKWIDVGVIDRFVHLTGDVARASGGLIRGLQNGVLQQYAIIFALGTLAILYYLVFFPY
ncbi:MAG: NADH-quinone oxidoreductase subunit L [SAR324 cluster bacterium]|nr:NADH-quinone oxidoreductase subunit L [SAR324 cluster bacterium]